MKRTFRSSIYFRIIILNILGLLVFTYISIKEQVSPRKEPVFDRYVYALELDNVYPTYILNNKKHGSIKSYIVFYSDSIYQHTKRPDFNATFASINTQAIVIDTLGKYDILKIEYIDARSRRRQGYVFREFIHDTIAPIKNDSRILFNSAHRIYSKFNSP